MRVYRYVCVCARERERERERERMTAHGVMKGTSCQNSLWVWPKITNYLTQEACQRLIPLSTHYAQTLFQFQEVID